jgi:Transposase DDE domain
MYIRAHKTINRKTGKEYIKYSLVEGYRNNDGKVRQRIIMSLGSTLLLSKDERKMLASVLELRLSGKASLFEENNKIKSLADEAMQHYDYRDLNNEDKKKEEVKNPVYERIDLNSIASSSIRQLGPELIGHAFYQRLGFNDILKQCKLTPYQISIAEAVIVGRLVNPGSDLDTWKWIRNRSSILELVDENISKAGKDAVYKVADKLIKHKNHIEKELHKKESLLFPEKNKLFLYDLTNTYLEGSGIYNELAKRGKSKERRSDCPLITLALLVNSKGFPLFSQIYKGNQSEPETLENVLNRLTSEVNMLPEFMPTIIMDRGIATKDNIALLKERHYQYVVVERRPSAKDFIKDFETAKDTFTQIHENNKDYTEGVDVTETNETIKDTEANVNVNETTASDSTTRIPTPTQATITPAATVQAQTVQIDKHSPCVNPKQEAKVYVKKIPCEEGSKVLVLSEGRKEKEKAMDSLKEKRFMKDIDRLRKSISKRNVVKQNKVSIRMGRIQERYPSVSRYYELTILMNKDDKEVTDINVVKKESRDDRTVLTGCYVIETTHKDCGAEEIWDLYHTLTHVEYSFRCLKTDLGMRPIYHHTEVRTRGHLFISVLAYHLLISIENTLRENNDTRKWETIKKELSTHHRTTVIMNNDKNHIHHIRVSSQPEDVHKDIYRKLKVKDSTRRKHKVLYR